MLLQNSTLKPSPNGQSLNFVPIRHPNSVSLSPGIVKDLAFSGRIPVLSTSSRARNNHLLLATSSTSKIRSHDAADHDKNPRLPKWLAAFKKITALGNRNPGVAAVLNQEEKEGKYLSKWELCRAVKELRKFKRYHSALEVYEWMNERGDRFSTTAGDAAIQLDLIAKVHGIPPAEAYFSNLNDLLKDKRVYSSLLNSFVGARMQAKAESLMEEIRNRGYASEALTYNVMMTLYLNLKDQHQIESLVAEMKQNNVALDIYSYNIWLSSLGSHERMEDVLKQIELDPSTTPNRSTFCSMAASYIRLGHVEKACGCLKKVENRLSFRDRIGYHHLISLYATAGDKEAVYRVWNAYKSSFASVSNSGYCAVISALVKMDDIGGAEMLHEEWISVKSRYEARIGNLVMGWYQRKGVSEKVVTMFNQMLELGGKPDAMTWEILAEDHIRNRRIPEAVSCLRNALNAESSRRWSPKPGNVAAICRISEEDGDGASREALAEVLKQAGCHDHTMQPSVVAG